MSNCITIPITLTKGYKYPIFFTGKVLTNGEFAIDINYVTNKPEEFNTIPHDKFLKAISNINDNIKIEVNIDKMDYDDEDICPVYLEKKMYTITDPDGVVHLVRYGLSRKYVQGIIRPLKSLYPSLKVTRSISGTNVKGALNVAPFLYKLFIGNKEIGLIVPVLKHINHKDIIND